jgi:antitoxin component HigA of HigAB toxin-antitoxin module
MLAAVKTPLIKQNKISPVRYITFTFKRTTPRKILDEISVRYEQYLAPALNKGDTDDEYISVTDSEWYKNMSKSMTPGNYLKTLRESCGHTQNELGIKLGVSASRVCDFEAGRRQITKTAAKKLSSMYLVPAEKFI